MSLEFLKRHRNKFATLATALGGLYVAKKAYDYNGWSNMDWFRSAPVTTPDVIKARRKFIFDSLQESCDKQVLQTVIDLLERLQKRFDPAPLIERLKIDSTLDNEQKLNLWEEVKLKSFARIIALAYMQSIVLLALKVQKSILGRETFNSCVRSDHSRSGVIQYVASWFTQPVSNYMHMFADPKAQQIFLNCVQYLNTHGLNSFYDRVESCTTDILGDISLNEDFTPASLQSIFKRLKASLECNAGDRNFADLVVPVVNPNIVNKGYNAAHLEELLSHLVSCLQSPKAQELLSGFVESYINRVTFLLNEYNNESPKYKLASWLPPLCHMFDQLVTTGHNSIIQENLNSNDLYLFSHSIYLN